jgi:dimethylamine monooxygenase subunit A
VSGGGAHFFPVKAEPLRMQPGLFRFGHDFGNGRDDTRHLLRDSSAPDYRAAKRRVLEVDSGRALLGTGDESRHAVYQAISEWLRQTLHTEHGIELPPRQLSNAELVREAYVEIALALQEDFVVLHRGTNGSEQAALVCVCFPSAWRPERIAGRSFLDLHASVPEFESVAARSATLVSAMIERGPYVRFVWNVVADSRLDHHPDRSPRAPWTADQPGFLRVERQLSVPFAAQQASLFLIRTYLYPLSELSTEERSTLRSALTLMTEPVRRYKGLASALPGILARLA